MSPYQFSTYPWEENKERRHKRWRRKTIKREDRTRGTEISRESAGRPAFLGVGLATSEHQCLWNKASGVLGDSDRSTIARDRGIARRRYRKKNRNN